MEIKILAVGEQSQEIARILTPGDNDNVFNARVHEGLDRIEYHRSVIHWQEMLVSYSCERIKPRAFSTRQDHTFHGILSPYLKIKATLVTD